MAQNKVAKGTRGRNALRSFGAAVATVPRRGIEVAASLAVLAATAAAIILALHVVFSVFSANPNNGIVEFVNGLSGALAWKFDNLFLFKQSPRIEVLVNYGLAAVFYLVIGRLVGSMLRRLA